MSIVQQFNDGLSMAMEGKSQEEQDRMMKMLADALVSGSGTNELGWFVIGFSLVFCEII